MLTKLPSTDLKYLRNIKSLSLVLCSLLFFSSAFAQTADTAHKVNKVAAPDKTTPPGDTSHKASNPADTSQKDKISFKDATEISYQATSVVQTLESILNSVTFNDNTPSELAGYITNSYTAGQRSRVFYNKDIIIEDDIDPKFELGKNKDVAADKYLNNLDLQYEKTADFSIKFTDLKVSDVKKKSYIFVNVKYVSNFASKYTPNGTTYPKRDRVALIRMEKNGKNWLPLIESISYYDPKYPIDGKDNDILVVASDTANSVANLHVPTQEDINKAMIKMIADQEETDKKNQAQFDSYVATGDGYLKKKQYAEALDIYGKAKQIKPFVPALDKKIIETKKLLETNTFKYWNDKGNKAKTDRDFATAILCYRNAISLNNEAATKLNPLVDSLNAIKSIIDLPRNMIQDGNFPGAIEECENRFKKYKDRKSEYPPEMYLMEGEAYLKMFANKPDDKNLLSKAYHFINTAIDNFNTFREARIVRGDAYENYTVPSDWARAINDYDNLTANATDDDPEKPGYFARKGHLKDRRHQTDWPKWAIADYNTAISLSRDQRTVKDEALGPKEANFYYSKGELQYRADMNADAQASLDSAIILNPKLAMAYYIRGLNYVKINNNTQAGIDFARATQLGLEPARLSTIDSISFEYFKKGRELAAKRDFANADSAYDGALKINKCNASAFHGKAEARFTMANEFISKKDTASATPKYKESIELNLLAVGCKPDLSDAFYKAGLANAKIMQYDLAIANFGKAVKADANNYQAYVERGNTYQIQRKYVQAVEDYNNALNILTADYAQARGNDKALAQRMVDSAISTNVLKGAAQYYMADYPHSILSLNKALESSDNKSSDAYYYLGLVYYAQGDLSKSTTELGEAIKLKRDFRYFYASGKTYYKSKKYDEAVSNFLLATNSDSLNIYRDKLFLSGLCYFKNKKYPEALANFDNYNKTSTAKNDSSFYAYYGVTELLNSQDSSAVKSLNYAVSKTPGNALALYGLGCFYAKNPNNYNKALEYFENAFLKRSLSKDDLKPFEDNLLTEFIKVRDNKNSYNRFKKASFSSN